MIKIIICAGARPNFMKIAPLLTELGKHRGQFETLLVHTGQHFDHEMSEIFFRDLRMAKPDVHLNIGAASQAVQTARIMAKFERILLRERPHLVIVVGDVNSTLACSLVAAKLGIKVAHVESGLRSFDRTMPEEINRVVTDSLSDYLFVSEPSGMRNLKKEGADPRKVFFVGNVMIDSLSAHMGRIDASDILGRMSLDRRSYGVVTIHRPNNVDRKRSLEEIMHILKSLTRNIKIVYPVHPRSRYTMALFGLTEKFRSMPNLIMVKPMGYLDFIKLIKESQFVLTDSGGIQEETTFLRVPCLTMRDNTERPTTITDGSNMLVGRNKDTILACTRKIMNGDFKKARIPKLWDGKAASRIVQVLKKDLYDR